jgi:hypothetical protein
MSRKNELLLALLLLLVNIWLVNMVEFNERMEGGEINEAIEAKGEIPIDI